MKATDTKADTGADTAPARTSTKADTSKADTSSAEAKKDDTPKVTSDCVVKSDFHVGRAVNGKVCSYHAMHYDADGNRR